MIIDSYLLSTNYRFLKL